MCLKRNMRKGEAYMTQEMKKEVDHLVSGMKPNNQSVALTILQTIKST